MKCCLLACVISASLVYYTITVVASADCHGHPFPGFPTLEGPFARGHGTVVGEGLGLGAVNGARVHVERMVMDGVRPGLSGWIEEADWGQTSRRKLGMLC